jgi:hypothetical protein
VELREVLRQINLVVKRLDGINRLRFRKNPEQLALWARAKDLNWPAQGPKTPPAAPKKDGKETVA